MVWVSGILCITLAGMALGQNASEADVSFAQSIVDNGYCSYYDNSWIRGQSISCLCAQGYLAGCVNNSQCLSRTVCDPSPLCDQQRQWINCTERKQCMNTLNCTATQVCQPYRQCQPVVRQRRVCQYVALQADDDSSPLPPNRNDTGLAFTKTVNYTAADTLLATGTNATTGAVPPASNATAGNATASAVLPAMNASAGAIPPSKNATAGNATTGAVPKPTVVPPPMNATAGNATTGAVPSPKNITAGNATAGVVPPPTNATNATAGGLPPSKGVNATETNVNMTSVAGGSQPNATGPVECYVADYIDESCENTTACYPANVCTFIPTCSNVTSCDPNPECQDMNSCQTIWSCGS